MKWINSAAKNKNSAIFYYGEINKDGIMNNPVGCITKWDGKRPFWVVGGNKGTTDTVGQAKSIVQKLVKKG